MDKFPYLIAPLSPSQFFEKHWEQAFLHLHREKAHYFDMTLSKTDIDNFLSLQNLMPDGIHVVKNGDFIQKTWWTNDETLLDGTQKKTVCPEKIMECFKNGATIIINSAEKNLAKLAKTCIEIEQELHIKIQANIYITPPNSKGFQLHYDPHDIFSMQIEGTKLWKIYDSGEELPTTYRSFRKKPQLTKAFTMHAGDLLYMPRGTVHEAVATNETSIHLNFSCKPVYGFHLIEAMASLAEKSDPFFRYTIPHGIKSDRQRQAYLALFTSHIQKLADSTCYADLLQEHINSFDNIQLEDFSGRFSTLLLLDQVSLETTVVKVKNLSFHLKDSDTGTTLLFSNHKLTFPPFIQYQLLLDEQPFQVKQISGLISNAGKLDIVKNLLKVGFLEIAEGSHTQLNKL